MGKMLAFVKEAVGYISVMRGENNAGGREPRDEKDIACRWRSFADLGYLSVDHGKVPAGHAVTGQNRAFPTVSIHTTTPTATFGRFRG